MARVPCHARSAHPGGPAWRHEPPARTSGIALMVVMVVFIVLYMIVYHLHFYTTMEEKLSRVRYGEVEAQDALHSVAQRALADLIRDLVEDSAESAAEGQEGGAIGAGDPSVPPAAAAAPATRAEGRGDFAAIEMPAAAGAPGSGASRHIDSLYEPLFEPADREYPTFGNVQVKWRVVDNERRFDLNQLFGYVRLPGDEDLLAAGGAGAVSAEDLERMGREAGAGEEGTQRLTESLRSRIRIIGRDGDAQGGDAAAAETPEAAAETQARAAMGLAEEGELAPFTEPEPLRQEATAEMLARAIEMVLSLNEDAGFFYQGTYNAERIARDIVEYVLIRRRSEGQNRIYDTAELLNIDTITPELFFGPALGEVPEDGLYLNDADGFAYKVERDEFGDLVATYLDGFEEEPYLDPALAAEWGLGELAGDLGEATPRPRPQRFFDEETGKEYIRVPPLPIGIQDLFTTISTGKININTAPVAVLYSLLPSLFLRGSSEDAATVAALVRAYRETFQSTEEGVEGAVPGADTSSALGGLAGTGGSTAGADPLDPLAWTDPSGLGAYGGLGGGGFPTNTFASLADLEKIDGTDGGPEDILRSDMGADRVSDEDDPLLQKVQNDYGPVMVFGSTYFTIELDAKVEKSPYVKKGILVVKRDPAKELLEVILWKELQN